MTREISDATARAMKSDRRRKWKRQAGYAAVTLAAATMLASCGSPNRASADKEAAPRVAVVRVTRQDLSNRLEIASEFLPYQEIDVYAKVSGYIQKLNIDWGTHVQKGQLMAVLEIPELEQQLDVDQAAVKRAEQDVARSQEELNRAQSAYTVAHLTYTRLANVQKARPELVAQEEIDVAQGKDTEASAAVSGAKDALAGSEQALAAAKAGLARDQAMYSYSQITAPFTGIVTKLDAYTGALLPAGTSSNEGDQPLCRLSQNDLLRLVIPVPERAVPSIHLGEIVDVNVSALKKTFSGKIVRTADSIDMATRTMHTEVQVPNPRFELVPGMYASVRIPIESAASALAIPVQAVQSSGNGQGTVLVVDQSNRIEQRTVKLGLQTATDFEVLAGLQDGDRVVFGEQNQYKPGELVAPAAVNAAAVE